MYFICHPLLLRSDSRWRYSSLVNFLVWAAFIASRVLPQMVSSSRATFVVCICTITISGLEEVLIIFRGMVDCDASEALRPGKSAKIMLVTSSCWRLRKILSRTESCRQVYLPSCNAVGRPKSMTSGAGVLRT